MEEEEEHSHVVGFGKFLLEEMVIKVKFMLSIYESPEDYDNLSRFAIAQCEFAEIKNICKDFLRVKKK